MTKVKVGVARPLANIDCILSLKHFLDYIGLFPVTKKFNRYLCVRVRFSKMYTKEHNARIEKGNEKASFGYFHVPYYTTYYFTTLLLYYYLLTTTIMCETSVKLQSNFFVYLQNCVELFCNMGVCL